MLQFTYRSRETARYQIRIQAHELTLQEFIFMYMYLNLILKFIICVLLYFTVSIAKWLLLQNSVSKGGCTSGITAMHFSWRPAEQVNFIVFNTCTWTNTALCLTLSYCTREGGGTNFKDSYLCNEYCYCNDIWWLFIEFIEEDSGVLLRPVLFKPLPTTFSKAILTIFT